MKLLKDIRDYLRDGVRPPGPNDNDNDDDNHDNDDGSVFLNNLNNEISNIKSDGEYYLRLIAYQNAAIGKLQKELTDKKIQPKKY